MKIPSGKYFSRKAVNSFLRFPAPVLFSFVVTVLAIISIENSYSFDNAPLLFRFLLTSGLAIPLFIAVQLLNERLETHKKIQYLTQFAGFVLLVLYFFNISDVFYTRTIIRFFAYLGMLALSISFAPFIGFRQNTAFWQFNSILLVRFLRTALYGIILYVAVSLAFVAIEQLFDVSFGEELYFQLWVIISAFFGTWFFLAAIPRYIDKLDHISDYSNALKIFVQFILIPIVILYSLILYAYFIKVIAMWEWPHGWVSSLILGYSILSIFTFLVIYPIRKSPVNTYVRFFSGFFPYLPWPLILILFVSVFKRISDYGVTENRYFVIIMGIWLLFIMTHLLMTRFRNIKMIPVSLAITMFLAVTGPWNAFMISKNSQTERFESILTKYNKIDNGVYVKNRDVMDYSDYNNLVSHTNFILSNYGHSPFIPYFPKSLDTIKWDSVFIWEYSTSNPILDIMEIEYTEDTTMNSNIIYLNTQSAQKGMMFDISGFNLYCPFKIYAYTYPEDTNDTNIFEYKSYKDVRIKINSDLMYLKVFYNDTLVDEFDIASMVNSIPSNIIRDSSYELPAHYLIRTDSINRTVKTAFYINSLSGNYYRNKLESLTELDGFVLIRFK